MFLEDKQASDDEDNEIEIVEPKTDLITLDSDDDEPTPPAATSKTPPEQPQQPLIKIQKSIPATPPTNTTIAQSRVVITPLLLNQQKTPTAVSSTSSSASNNVMTARGTYVPPTTAAKITPIKIGNSPAPVPPLVPVNNTTSGGSSLAADDDDNMDLMSMAQSFLASMLEVDANDGSSRSSCDTPTTTPHTKKQPRKKMTNKPNPTLLKQKALMELERLEEMKRNDQKLKMKCKVELSRAEDEYPFVKSLLEAKKKTHEEEETENGKEKRNSSDGTTMMVNTGQETIEVHLVIEDDALNSSNEEKSNSKKEKEKSQNEMQEKRKVSTEGKESNEINQDGSNKENKKDTSMDVFEISDDVMEEVKDQSLEIIETDKISEKETTKETEKQVVDNGISFTDPKDMNDEISVRETTEKLVKPKESKEAEDTSEDVSKTEVDTSEQSAKSTTEETTTKNVADIDDVEVYQEIEKVLQRKSSGEESQSTTENKIAEEAMYDDIITEAEKPENHNNSPPGEIEKDSNNETQTLDEVEENPPTPLVDETMETETDSNLVDINKKSTTLEAGISSDDLITKEQISATISAAEEEELPSVTTREEEQKLTTANGDV
ncbi:peptidyl-prolyl cis-trans isomerase 1-like [Musca vetustissima]|uniref:peptidyl-prolyl cis-trans isomerase 1-like n=1 Tax=Musca vetustissima TaxID=27455 RepID=UPI002AB68818|nr:peptidyl-prolyl cis-trans isomerase 1-like [Musca vetustissima]